MGKYRDENRHKWTKRPSQSPKGDRPRGWGLIWILAVVAVATAVLLGSSQQ